MLSIQNWPRQENLMNSSHARNLLRPWLAIVVIAVFAGVGTLPAIVARRTNAQKQRFETFEQYRAERLVEIKERFKSAREILVNSNVPFDPDELLDDEHWRTNLAFTLS